MDQTIFSKLELECGMEKENERLKNQIALLEKENELLKQKEVERTKLNMEAECACIYSHGDGIYVYVELEQMDRLLANCSGLKYNTHDQNQTSWGFSIKFVSIASARTCLLRNGYKFSYVSLVDARTNHSDHPIYHHVENWFRGV